MGYLVLGLVVLGVNLLPAFGPATWTILVFARLRWHYDPVALVAIGVVASSLGRFALGSACRALRSRLSGRYRENLESLAARLAGHRKGAIALAGLFVLSPLPSAQLFCAAGLVGARLVPLTVAFAAGRVVTYSLYVGAATAVDARFSGVLDRFWGQPWWIALQVVLVVGVAALPLRPWRAQSPARSR